MAKGVRHSSWKAALCLALEDLWRRLKTWPGGLSFGLAIALLAVAVGRIFTKDVAPDRDWMAMLAAVDVGLLIALAVEKFGTRIGTVEQKQATVAGRTMPVAFGLLLALVGSVDEPGRPERWIAAVILLVTTSGVLSVIFSALDRAEEPANENASAPNPTG
jgi:peptidoglycan/LPS O-acetylase OafA/YrhL